MSRTFRDGGKKALYIGDGVMLTSVRGKAFAKRISRKKQRAAKAKMVRNELQEYDEYLWCALLWEDEDYDPHYECYDYNEGDNCYEYDAHYDYDYEYEYEYEYDWGYRTIDDQRHTDVPDFIEELQSFASMCDRSLSPDDGPMLAAEFRDAAFVITLQQKELRTYAAPVTVSEEMVEKFIRRYAACDPGASLPAGCVEKALEVALTKDMGQ